MLKINRRQALKAGMTGIAGLGASLVWQDPMQKWLQHSPLLKPKSFGASKSIILIHANGGPSQIETFSYKPELWKWDGRFLPNSAAHYAHNLSKVQAPICGFKQHGNSGAWVADMFTHIQGHVDDLCLIHSLTARGGDHALGNRDMATGQILTGAPHFAAWLSYHWQERSHPLPSFIVLPDERGLARSQFEAFSSGFLPPEHTGLVVVDRRHPIENFNRAKLELIRDFLRDNSSNPTNHRKSSEDAASLFLDKQIKLHETLRADDDPLISRFFHLDDPDTRPLGEQLYAAFKLVRRGAPYIQIIHGGSTDDARSWDSHQSIDHQRTRIAESDRPISGLLAALKATGLDTQVTVVWAGEFGRLPFVDQSLRSTNGRDHNPNANTIWLFGAGIKRALQYGVTDELGLKTVENVLTWTDLHKTFCHLLGVDAEELVFSADGTKGALINEHSRLIEEILV